MKIKYPVWYYNNYKLLLKSITVPKIKLSKLLYILSSHSVSRIRTHGLKQTINHTINQSIKVIRVL